MVDKNHRLLTFALAAALLAAAGTAFCAPWTNDPIQVGSTTIRAVHINEMRTQLNNKRLEFGMTVVTFTDGPQVQAGVTLIRSQHFTELQTDINNIRSTFHPVCANVPAAYSFTGGVATGGVIRETFITDLRQALDQIGTVRVCCGLCKKMSGTTCVSQTAAEDLWSDCAPDQSTLAVNKFSNCYTDLCNGSSACTYVTAGTDPSGQCSPPQATLDTYMPGKVSGCYQTMCDGSGGCYTVVIDSDPVSACTGLCRSCDSTGGCHNTTANLDPELECLGRCNVCNGSGACTFATAGTDPNIDCPPPQAFLNASANKWSGCYRVNFCSGTTAECAAVASGSNTYGQCPPSQATLDALIPPARTKVSGCYQGNCNGTGGCLVVPAQGPPTPNDNSVCAKCYACDGSGGCTFASNGSQTAGCNTSAGSCNGASQCNGAGNCTVTDPPAGNKGSPPCSMCKACDGGGTCNGNVASGTSDTGCNSPAGSCITALQTCNGMGGCNYNYRAQGNKGSPLLCPMCYSCDTTGGCTNPMTGLQDPLMGCGLPIGQCKDSIDTCNNDGTCNHHYSALNTKSTCTMCKSCGDQNGSCTNNMTGQDTLMGCNALATTCRSADTCSGGSCIHTNASNSTHCAACTACDGSGSCNNTAYYNGSMDPIGGCATMGTTCRGADTCSSGSCTHTNASNSTHCAACTACNGSGSCNNTAYYNGIPDPIGGCGGTCQYCSGGACLNNAITCYLNAPSCDHTPHTYCGSCPSGYSPSPSIWNNITCRRDDDSDGYCAAGSFIICSDYPSCEDSGYVAPADCAGNDCDDGNGAKHPGVTNWYTDATDYNCSGYIENQFGGSSPGNWGTYNGNCLADSQTTCSLHAIALPSCGATFDTPTYCISDGWWGCDSDQGAHNQVGCH